MKEAKNKWEKLREIDRDRKRIKNWETERKTVSDWERLTKHWENLGKMKSLRENKRKRMK